MAKASLHSGSPVAPRLAGRVLLFAIPVALSSGCGDGAEPNLPASQVRDSAGVRIVENARPADDSRLPWRIGPEPTVSIGALTGEEPYLLHRADDAVMLPDGRIAIANTGTNEIRVFDASGLHQATLGRAGDGPGEFTALAGVASWPGDSIVAWDSRVRTVAVFDSEGGLGRSFVLDGDDRPDEPRMALSDGTVLGRAVDAGGGPGYRRENSTYELHDATGSVRVSLGDHPGRESFINMDGRMAVFGLLPFSRSLHEASWGESVILTPDDHYEIRVHDGTTGALAHIIRREYPARNGQTGAAVDGLRSGREGARVCRDARGTDHPGDWRRVHPGARDGRPGCGVGAGVAAGAGGGLREAGLAYFTDAWPASPAQAVPERWPGSQSGSR